MIEIKLERADSISNKRISLVFNYKRSHTYGMNALAGAIEASGLLPAVQVLFESRTTQLISAIEKSAAESDTVLVAWSCYSPEFTVLSDELRHIQASVRSEKVIHIAGGPHPTGDHISTLRAGFDLIARGEGESLIVELIHAISTGSDGRDVTGIRLVENGKVLGRGFGKQIILDDYPPFAYSFGKFNPIEITRGCRYTCKFCQTPFMFKGVFRHRSVDNVSHYVQVMKEHGLRDIRFISPSAFSYGSNDQNVRHDEIENLLYSVRNIVGAEGRIFFGTFPSEVRPEHVTPEVLSTVKKYVDNDNIIIGGQSGSNRILEFCNRGHTVADILYAVEACLVVGFLPNVDFIFGLPDESMEDMELSVLFAEELARMGAKIHAHSFMPLPGTPFGKTEPSLIPEHIIRRLKRLESQGKLYGDWLKQIEISEELLKRAKEIDTK